MKQDVAVAAPPTKYTLQSGRFEATDYCGFVNVSFPFRGDVELDSPGQLFSKPDLKELIDFLTLVHTYMENN